MNRDMEGEDQKYAQSTSGPGSNAKKQMLLRAWLKDGGQLQKHYRQAVTAFELKNVSKQGYKWRSWKKTCDDLGKDQALGMLKRGTLKWRKNPLDPKYMEFAVHSEEYKQEATKTRGTRLKASSSKATKEETLADYENLTLDDLKAEGNWGMEVVGEEDDVASMDLEPDLKKFFGSNKNKDPKDPEDNPKTTEKKNKWCLLPPQSRNSPRSFWLSKQSSAKSKASSKQPWLMLMTRKAKTTSRLWPW